MYSEAQWAPKALTQRRYLACGFPDHWILISRLLGGGVSPVPHFNICLFSRMRDCFQREDVKIEDNADNIYTALADRAAGTTDLPFFLCPENSGRYVFSRLESPRVSRSLISPCRISGILSFKGPSRSSWRTVLVSPCSTGKWFRCFGPSLVQLDYIESSSPRYTDCMLSTRFALLGDVGVAHDVQDPRKETAAS